jgi:hypothetical protein
MQRGFTAHTESVFRVAGHAKQGKGAGFHGGDHEERHVLGRNAMWVYYKPTFLRNV